MTAPTPRPSPLALATARLIHDDARRAGTDWRRYLSRLDVAALARLVAGRASLEVSPFNPERPAVLKQLLAKRVLGEEIWPAVAASAAAAGWASPLTSPQVWVNPEDDNPPSRSRLSDDLAPFPALATKPVGGLWTSTPLPGMPTVWATDAPLDVPPLSSAASLWRLDAPAAARVVELTSRADWVALVERFGVDSTAHYRPRLAASTLAWSEPFVAPDWEAVAAAYDVVHLTWAGFVDASFEVVPLRGGGCTALCGWGSESALWLRWLFDKPPLRWASR